jgi:hypothetical protein
MPKKTVWYERWEKFLNFLESKPSNYEIMGYVNGLIDDCRGFRYNRIATSSSNSLLLFLLSDMRKDKMRNQKLKAMIDADDDMRELKDYEEGK